VVKGGDLTDSRGKVLVREKIKKRDMWIDVGMTVIEDLGIGAIVGAGLRWPTKLDAIPSWQAI
jgi:hypothetical protein